MGASTDSIFKRKFPRRRFQRAMGLLCHGKYSVGVGVEIGEGGVSLSLPQELPVGQEIVISFQIPSGSFVCVRAEIRSSVKSRKAGWFALGCLFKSIKFEQKREIRSYVSARSELEQ